MKKIKVLFAGLCVAAVLAWSGYSVSSGQDKVGELRRAYDCCLYQEVREELSERVSIVEKSLKNNLSCIEEVFDGFAVQGELGVEVKVYRNKEQDNYYYFLMASVDKHVDNSSEDRFFLLNSLCFSFDEVRFLSKLSDYSSLGGVTSDGRAKCSTFVLDDSVREFYVGVKYYDKLDNKEDFLVYKLRIKRDEQGYKFQGLANGDICFERKIGD